MFYFVVIEGVILQQVMMTTMCSIVIGYLRTTLSIAYAYCTHEASTVSCTSMNDGALSSINNLLASHHGGRQQLSMTRSVRRAGNGFRNVRRQDTLVLPGRTSSKIGVGRIQQVARHYEQSRI